MVKKQKKKEGDRKRKEATVRMNYRWVIAGVFILLLVLINIAGGNNPIVKSIFGRFLPMVSPTPTVFVKVLTPDKLTTDQAIYVKMAMDVLSAKLSIKSSEIKIIDVSEKKWNDTSLGCPEKGKLYLQVITPGYTIELSAKGKTYHYNGGLNSVISC